MLQTQDLHVPDSDAELEALSNAASTLGRETVEVSGFLSQLDSESRAQLALLREASSATAQLQKLTQQASETATQVGSHSREALEEIDASATDLKETSLQAQQLAEWVKSVHAGGSQVDDMLVKIQSSTVKIADIAAAVNLLAINAKIEAARAGQAGKGFAIVAESINELSGQTSSAANAITEVIEELTQWVGHLSVGAMTNSATADGIISQGATTNSALERIKKSAAQVTEDARRIEEVVSEASASSSQLAPAVARVEKSVGDVTDGIEEAHGRSVILADTSEGILQNVVALGGATNDGPMITLVQDLAGQVSNAFESAVSNGRIKLDDLFVRSYAPISGSDPQQVMAPFTTLTDEVLPPIQEPVLKTDPLIVFCAAVDTNGYLPTHNLKFGQPQTDDPVWNAANCRNRRIFDDRVGLKAGRNTSPFLLQVYRRDMGGGNFVMMKDLSAPIFVQGRHWGGLRLAYKFAQ